MESTISPGCFFHNDVPFGGFNCSPQTDELADYERYLGVLLAERQNLGSFVQIFPVCSMLLNQEIMMVKAILSQKVADFERMGHNHQYKSFCPKPNANKISIETWKCMQAKDEKLFKRLVPLQPSSLSWPLVQGKPNTPLIKRIIRLDVPVEKYPTYNFVGRILGPRGNSLKRVESATQCRIFIRGQGSVKDSSKEDKLKDKPGYEHLNEPLHILIEAEFSEDVIDDRLNSAISVVEELLTPVDESMDVYKRQQLRELALLNGTLKEINPRMSPSVSPSMSPFDNTGMKRAKTET